MSLFDLSGHIAIVTGGNGGIGLGMAQGLASAGAVVVLAGRNVKKGEAAVQRIAQAGGKAEFAKVDVTSEASCRALIDEAAARHGRLDTLVNNAGTNIRKPADKLSAAEWHTVIDTNLTLHARRLSAHAEGRARQDHQYRIDDVDLRYGLRARLRGEQGRHRAVHARLRDRLGEREHPGQCGAAGLDRYRSHARRPARNRGPQRERARAYARRPLG